MNKRTIALFALIALIVIAMFLPWAYLWEDTHGPGVPNTYRPQLGLYPLGAPIGLLFTSLSFAAALAALVLSLFSAKRTVCRILCGLLLLVSAGLCLYEGISSSFERFTVLTWGIFGALILVGVWTLLFVGKKSRRHA